MYPGRRFKLDRKKITILAGALAIILISLFIFWPRNPGLNIKMVSGTEYISGENGQVIARVSDRNGNPYTDVLCAAKIIYPDKSYFLLDQPLSESSEPGNYYLQFVTPTINGIYEYIITCDVPKGNKNETLKISSSFHVSPALNFIVEMSILQAERYRDILSKINQTREELLAQINETFSEDILAALNDNSGQIINRIDSSKNETMTNVNNKFEDFNKDMADLGNSMANIFGNNS